MVTPKEAFASAENVREKSGSTTLLERPENFDTAVDLEAEKQKAREDFEIVFARLNELSEHIESLVKDFADLEAQAEVLAEKGGGKYIPQSVVQEVISNGLEDAPVEIKTKSVEQKTTPTVQTHLPSELGQVILEATRDQDAVSSKSFANTVPDQRTHRRASLGAEPVVTSIEPVTQTAPVEVFKLPEQPKEGIVDELAEKAEKPQEFATFDEYLAYMENKHPSEGGIIPREKIFQDAKTGKIVSPEKYANYAHAKKNETTHYYDELNGVNNKSEISEERDYTSMTIPELAREAGKVSYINPGDETHIDSELAKIRETAKAKYKELARKDGTEGEQDDESNMEDFEALAGRYKDMVRDKEKHTEVEPKGLREKAKAWWGKNREKFGVTYWAARFTTGYNAYLDRGVDEGMGDTEIDKIRNKNRKKIILGSIGLGLAGGVGVAATIGLVHELLTPDTVAASVGPGPDHFIAGPASFHGELGGSSGAETLHLHIPGQEAVGTPELSGLNDAAFNVPSGGTGEQLFKSLNMNPLDFYKHQEELLKMSPGDFYRMKDGSVGLAHSGWLSDTVRSYLTNIRSQ